MALKKTVEYKGFQPDYWAITERRYHKRSDQTFVTLECYKNRATRVASIDNQLDELQKKYSFTGDLNTASSYTGIKSVDALFTDAEDV